MPEPRRHVVIGLGGIGSWLIRLLVPFLHDAEPGAIVLALDGDAFEPGNRGRMAFARLGPKAVVLAEELAASCGARVNVVPAPVYVNARNAREWIREGDVVFCAPDNHATRRIVERRCARLHDVTLFLGGNEGTSDPSRGALGAVLVYRRERGRDLTHRPSRFHPEIARPADRPPDARGCGSALPDTPQLVFTNAAVAVAMLSAFFSWRSGALEHEEMFVDVRSGRMTPVSRRRIRRVRGA